MVSIIIPTYNEAENIGALINYLYKNADNRVGDIIVADAGSNDNTLQIAAEAGAKVILSPQAGRSAQMNYGASEATGDILYFIHADSFPPPSFVEDIIMAVKNGFECGRYRTKFNTKKWILKVNAFFTRFDFFICYGGDQTLFITKKLFDLINGFNERMRIMEDYEIAGRARAKAKYKIIQKDALVSARKYETNSWLTVQLANKKIIEMYKKGASQEEMVNKYKALLSYR